MSHPSASSELPNYPSKGHGYDGVNSEPCGARGTGSGSSWQAFEISNNSNGNLTSFADSGSSKLAKVIPKVETEDKGSGVQKCRLKLLPDSGSASGPMDVSCQSISRRRKSADIRLVGRHPEVYEPCDDSFALVDALLADRAHLRELQPSLCLEVGCGSGYVITSLALMFGDDIDKVQFLATDISEAAVESTFATLVAHDIKADVVVADLVSGLEERVYGAVDVLLFNPPYVPTPEEEVGIDGIASAWAGGDRGRRVIDRMLPLVDSLLSSKGWFYLVTVTANNPGEICQIMRRKGFASRIIIQRYTEEESLHVLKFWREATNDSSDLGGPTSPGSRTSLQRTLSQRLSRFVSFK